MLDNREVGDKGELLAKAYLVDNGYEILESNWRYKHKEIDIIASKNNMLCIVEVKTRRSDYLPPKMAVTHKKQLNLIVATNEYITINNIDKDIRFDIIEIIMQKNKDIKINHIIDAFTPQIS